MGLKKNSPGCGCCGCGCFVTCADSSSQEVCQVTFNIANMPDPLVYWREERFSLSGTTYIQHREITLNGFDQLNGSYITTRGSDCIWQNTSGSYSCTYSAVTYSAVVEGSCPDLGSTESTESGSCDLLYEFLLLQTFNRFHDIRLQTDGIPTIVSGANIWRDLVNMRPETPLGSNYFPCGTSNLQYINSDVADGSGTSCSGTGPVEYYAGTTAVSSS